MEYTDNQKRFDDCCVCEKQVSDRKKRILLFGKTSLAASVMDSLTFYLKKERNEDIADTRLKSLSEKDHICLNCANTIVRFKDLTEKLRATVEFLDRHIPSRKSGMLEVTPTLPQSTQPKQPGYANCRLELTPSTSTYAGPAPSLYPNDHDPPPPATTDVPHSQSGYDELSEADMMWNKYANPKQQPTATLNAIDEVVNKFENTDNAQTPTGDLGSIPEGVVTSPTSYPTLQYHAPTPTAGVSPHHQQYYNMQPQGTIPVSNAQRQQMYQQRRMGEGYPAHQQYLATANQQQHATVVAAQYQREQFAVTHQQHHTQQQHEMASHHHMQFSDPANQENMRVQSVPMASSFPGMLERGSPDVMTQSAPMNYTQTTYTMQQQPERAYVTAQGHAPQVQMMAQAHEGIYQHPGMGQQVHQPLQTGGQHGYQTVDGRTHRLQAEQQQQLYAQTQQSSFGSHFGVGGHPGRVLYASGVKRGVPSDLAAYEVAAKQMVIAHPQGMMGVPQAPVQQMVQQPVGMAQHAAGMAQHAAGMTQQTQYYAPH